MIDSIGWGVVFGIIFYGIHQIILRYIQPKTREDGSEFKQSQEFIQNIRDTVVKQLLSNDHTKVFGAIAKQKQILNDQNRPAIAIFISPNMFKELIAADNGNSPAQIEKLYDAMLGLEIPIAFLGDLPIYISVLLTKAPVFVVGAITWSFNR